MAHESLCRIIRKGPLKISKSLKEAENGPFGKKLFPITVFSPPHLFTSIKGIIQVKFPYFQGGGDLFLSLLSKGEIFSIYFKFLDFKGGESLLFSPSRGRYCKLKIYCTFSSFRSIINNKNALYKAVIDGNFDQICTNPSVWDKSLLL